MTVTAYVQARRADYDEKTGLEVTLSNGARFGAAFQRINHRIGSYPKEGDTVAEVAARLRALADAIEQAAAVDA